VLALAKAIRWFFVGVPPEATRKLVHIALPNWRFILGACFDSLPCKIFGPLPFMVALLGWALALGPGDCAAGLISFPLLPLLLIPLSECSAVSERAAGAGVLVLAYGGRSASQRSPARGGGRASGRP